MRTIWLIVLSASVMGIADEQSIHDHHLNIKQIPWFTGPLLAPSGYTVPPGHFNFEPYLYYVVDVGQYDSHGHSHKIPHFYSAYIQVQNKVGITQNLGFQFYFQAFYNQTEGQHYCNVGDLPIAFNIQLFRPEIEDKWPAVLLSLGVNIPLGKYQHLKAHLKRTDAIGAGSWLPTLTTVFSKLWNTSGIHFLNARLSFSYQIGTPVHVKGRNTYGGVSHTRGVVYPGNLFVMDASIQYNFTQRWVFASDLTYSYANRNRFSGKKGSRMRTPSNEQWTLAPAMEYNWNENLGIIGGCWFTCAGRNTTQFISGIVAVNVYF